MSWSVRFEATELALPHAGASGKFSFAVVRRPEHCVTVSVIEKDTEAPIVSAQVRLGFHRSSTDESGRAKVETPKGVYDVIVWKAGYAFSPRTVEVTEDLAMQIEAVAIPEENEFPEDP